MRYSTFTSSEEPAPPRAIGIGPLITMDGGVINDEMEGGTSMNFSQEVVQEFQLHRSTTTCPRASPLWVRINIVTRSGSNDFHGAATSFTATTIWPPIRLYSAIRSTQNPFFARRNPGFNVGGPIKKDKLFFFFNYEHLNQGSVLAVPGTLPSTSALSGVFPSPLHYNLDQPRGSTTGSTTRTISSCAIRTTGTTPSRPMSALRSFQLELQRQLVGPKHHGTHHHHLAEPCERFPVPVSLLGKQCF